MPDAPDGAANFAQPWSYSNESDLFGTLRGEADINPTMTAWAAYGLRRSDEANSLANLDVNNGATGAATTSRFDNTRKDKVDTAELGLRGTLRTGDIAHEWVASAAYFALDKKNAYAWDFFNTLATNLYSPTAYAQPAFTGTAFVGAYTTFSTWMLETQRLSEERQLRTAYANIAVSVVLGLAAALLGQWIAEQI